MKTRKEEANTIDKLAKFATNDEPSNNNFNSNDDNLFWSSKRYLLGVTSGADVNIANAQAVTPLHKACYFGQLAVVRALLKKGADFNAPDSLGDTPLHYASKTGFVSIVKALLANKAVASANTAGQTPIDVALDDSVKAAFTPSE